MKIIKPGFVWMDGAPNGRAILENIARMGRIAYQSQRTDGADKFVRNIIKRGHESVLEHEKLSIILTCDRGVTHELVRHRIASYTQESTRYCNYGNARFDEGVSYIGIYDGIQYDQGMRGLTADAIAAIVSEWTQACEDAERHYNEMIRLGATPQIARSVLNNSTKTQIGITMNLRAWRNFFKLRTAPDAHPQMRLVAEEILKAFQQTVPVVFEDL